MTTEVILIDEECYKECYGWFGANRRLEPLPYPGGAGLYYVSLEILRMPEFFVLRPLLAACERAEIYLPEINKI